MQPDAFVETGPHGGLPAPVWFILLFKALGFTLHEVPMNLWYAGILVAIVLTVIGSEHGRRFSCRLMGQMPVIVALGINFGIVPLLFLQLGFARVFYPATILMAWTWLGVIALLIPAYYGVYAYAFGLGRGTGMAVWSRACGHLAAGLFLCIGFVFANAMSLMENIGAWHDLWQRHSANGAALGTALNLGDPRLVPRWLLMFGLALTTTAVWAALDAGWFGSRESASYRRWATRFSLKLYTAGTVWFVVAGAWYAFGTWSPVTRQAMFAAPWIVLTALTVLAPAGPWLILWVAGRKEGEPGRGLATLAGLAQLGVLGLNAASRQVVQHLEIRPYLDVTRHATAVAWAPLAFFLVLLVLGLATVAWLVRQVALLPGETGEGEPARPGSPGGSGADERSEVPPTSRCPDRPEGDLPAS